MHLRLGSMLSLVVVVSCQEAFVYPSWTHARWYWNKYGWMEFARVKRCATSLRNTFTKEHFAVAVLVTMSHGLTSALALEVENAEFMKNRKLTDPSTESLWHKDGLTIFHNKHVPWDRTRDVGVFSPVTEVIIYPERSTVRTIENPSLTRDDLAILVYNSSEWTKVDLCRCTIAFITQELPMGHHMYVSGFTGVSPNEATRLFSTRGEGIVMRCSVGNEFGNFFCMRSDWNTYPFGLDAGAAVLDYNTTLLGIGCFTLKMHGEYYISHVTNLSHTPYRKWIYQVVYGLDVSSPAGMQMLNGPDHTRRLNNTCHQYDILWNRHVDRLPYEPVPDYRWVPSD